MYPMTYLYANGIYAYDERHAMILVYWIETFIFIRDVIIQMTPILILVDAGYVGIHHSKYWMPIHYDTIENGQNKKSHLLFFKSRILKLYFPLSVKWCAFTPGQM